VPGFVESLDAVEVGRRSGMPIAPVMIYGDDVSHVVSEQGIAYLYRTAGEEERRAALAAIAGTTALGRAADAQRSASLRARGIVAYPEDLGVQRQEARRSLLAAHSINELIEWSGGLYRPPERLRRG
jgi:malonate decarboxylase alpha subunit